MGDKFFVFRFADVGDCELDSPHECVIIPRIGVRLLFEDNKMIDVRDEDAPEKPQRQDTIETLGE
jgi:hypothetical protein